MIEITFLMDISPKWWIKARKDEKFLKKYVYEKFDSDYYPRIIILGRIKIDLDLHGISIKEEILDKIKKGYFSYEFLPEDEILKESYSISNGQIHFHPRRTRINSRLSIRVSISNNFQ